MNKKWNDEATDMEIDDADVFPLERLFVNPVAKVLDFLICNKKLDYSESDINKITNVSHRTLQRLLPLLKSEGIIKSRKSGKQYMYSISHTSERAKALEKYYQETIKENLALMQNFNQKIEA